MADTVSETLQRYAIIFNLLTVFPDMERSDLERESHRLAKRLGSLHGITAPEFYDKKLYNTLSVKLKELGYFSDSEPHCDVKRIQQRANMLLRSQVRQTIVDSVAAELLT